MSDDEEWLVTLKDGTSIDGRAALSALRVLRMMNTRDPQAVAELYSHAIGETEVLSSDAAAKFDPSTPFGRDELAILRNGASRDGGDIVFGNPFEDSPENLHVLRTVVGNRPYFRQQWKSDAAEGPDEPSSGWTR